MTARNRLALSLCISILFLTSTAHGQKVETAYDKAADFAKYKTYAWAKRDVPPPNPLLAAGFAASGGAPITGATMGAGSTSLDAMPMLLKGALVVDVVDARQQHIVWRAVAKTNLDYEKRSKMIDQVNKAVSAMFKKFPPEK